tara:strand:+ start:819 stop:1004 length:186 start_codon:yes stop_codon:yes gene_type:complete
MPEWAVREMVADWMGAGRAYKGKWPDPNDWTWLNDAWAKMKLHPKTIELIHQIVNELKHSL